MKLSPSLNQPILYPRSSRPTVRWRLTLLYSLLFVICGAALLASTYWLFANFAYSPPKPGLGPGGKPSPTSVKVATAMSLQRSIGLHRLQVYSGVALAIMALVSGALGWVVAGRVLAPLRTIIATADRISDANLHERLTMSGPRDELRLLADTIDRLLGRLEAAFDAQRRFVANASHELRTPLAMMRTTLDVATAKPGGVPPPTRELDAELRVDLDHADQLLESFLILARAQEGQLGDAGQVGLEPLITSALSDRAERIVAKGLTLEMHLGAVEVVGSATLLRRMIENVIENAVRSQPSQVAWSRLRSLHAPRSAGTSGRRQQRTSLLDPGCGRPAHRNRSNVSARTAPDHSDGHGLGLPIAAAVAAAHNGQLDLHARSEGGLRVEITLQATTVPHLAKATG